MLFNFWLMLSNLFILFLQHLIQEFSFLRCQIFFTFFLIRSTCLFSIGLLIFLIWSFLILFVFHLIHNFLSVFSLLLFSWFLHFLSFCFILKHLLFIFVLLWLLIKEMSRLIAQNLICIPKLSSKALIFLTRNVLTSMASQFPFENDSKPMLPLVFS